MMINKGGGDANNRVWNVCRLPELKIKLYLCAHHQAPVVQLDRMTDSGSVG